MSAAGDHLVGQLMRFKPEALSASGWAERAGVSRAIWSDLRRHGNPSRRTLERLLGAAGSSIAEFEALRVDPPTAPADTDTQILEGTTLQDRLWGWKGSPKAPLPVADCAEAGTLPGTALSVWKIDPGNQLDHVPRPPSLAGDAKAFAVTVVGMAMTPRFRAGRRIAVSPALTVAVEEDVLVRLADGKTGDSGDGDAFLAVPGQLRGSNSAAVMLHQPGLGVTASLPRSRIAWIAVIAGELF